MPTLPRSKTGSALRTSALLVLCGAATLIAACGDGAPAEEPIEVIPAGPPARDSMSASSMDGIAAEELLLALPWTTGRMNRAATPGQAQRTIDDVLLLSGEGFDRFIVTFRSDAPAFPGYTLEYVDGPAADCAADPSESSFDSSGEHYLQLRISAVRGHEDDGTNTSGPRTIRGGSQYIMAAHKTCDFEGTAEWVFDLSDQHAYRIMELQGPGRLLVDIQHPFTPVPDAPSGN